MLRIIPGERTAVIEEGRWSQYSPKGWRAAREAEGVGLGIVAALERERERERERLSFHVSVPMAIVGKRNCDEEFKVAEFLSSCYLCRKKLHGRDIYMYRGEKAFCSMECRYRQIVSDECQESCGSEMSNSPYTMGRLFSTGVAAA
ncbi:hypothetical protein QJS04_geneDACA013534 [Acorus gramineus]|uniref:FLZ-type domain-containing protein n=1 Tax=Acorus gramineus TaxID=55184 RepID=A0AAV9AJM0_ACOGR|nr:hypothetical protein QJS04_geneDACA013534 [Acorus gramineus]